MLEELYRYAVDHELTARPGFKPKRPKGYFHLSALGQFLDLEVREKNAPEVSAPDVGAAAQGSKYCNPLIEKAGIVLCIVNDEKKDKNIPVKHDFFLSFLEGGNNAEPLFGIAARALRDSQVREKMQNALAENKLKPADLVGFVVDGQYLERSEHYSEYWDEFRKRIQSPATEKAERCLITGELSQPMATVPKVSGLMSVGGHTSGDAFLCFDKDAFQSYGLKQSANAVVSEAAMTAVNAALKKLIGNADVLAGAKMVHWYSGKVSKEEDIFSCLFGSDLLEGEEEDIAESEEEREALKAAQKLVAAIGEGKNVGKPDMRYYMMPLSGAGGRMMVRGWYEGSYEELYRNISLWFEDLRLILPGGQGMTRPPKLKALCLRMLKPGGGAKVWERLDRELSNLGQRVAYAAIHGSPLPDEAAYRALQWLKADLLADDKDKKHGTETLVYQLLKAWLRRKQRKEGEEEIMGERLNRQAGSAAYLCGRLMAVYSAIQEKAMPEVNVGVAERYYAAAMAGPGLMIGKLSQLSQYHLAKLDRGLTVYFEKMLTEIYQNIGEQEIPTALTMMQQTEFALGYYQQKAQIYSKKEETVER
ncbi:MAG: type I-C CRISPR-associated protein Cas8c/Csd1 [Clostridium sp.]|nr:type I-C CRISPR-associated protein Cas8c/Csd1 [Acetatifactor muris]MCM1561981.1 type I-C CRISPR-associated protein Cas8c/Csd1 [Clostridium sp.]